MMMMAPRLHQQLVHCGPLRYADALTPCGCSIRKDRRMDHDDFGGEAMKRQSDSYGTSGLLRNFGHVSTHHLPVFASAAA